VGLLISAAADLLVRAHTAATDADRNFRSCTLSSNVGVGVCINKGPTDGRNYVFFLRVTLEVIHIMKATVAIFSVHSGDRAWWTSGLCMVKVSSSQVLLFMIRDGLTVVPGMESGMVPANLARLLRAVNLRETSSCGRTCSAAYWK
jgi:hypothetical protein